MTMLSGIRLSYQAGDVSAIPSCKGVAVGGFAKGCKPAFYRGKPAEVTVQKKGLQRAFGAG